MRTPSTVAAIDALLFVLEPRDAELHVVDGAVAREDGDTVVGLLPGEHAAVAEPGERGIGELRVLELGFLDADHVGLRIAQPLFEVRQADVERIDVPAGDFHAQVRRSAPWAR